MECDFHDMCLMVLLIKYEVPWDLTITIMVLVEVNLKLRSNRVSFHLHWTQGTYRELIEPN